MRQRRLKDFDQRMEKHGCWIVENAMENKGCWREYFSQMTGSNKNENKLYVEFGCGKGQFTVAHALEKPDNMYLAIEGQESVALLAAEKFDNAQANNIKLINEKVKDIEDFFGEGELDGLYLNFSDPWPKARHAKRRLTHRRFLESYKKIIKPGGFVEFKTDNDDLYDFSLEELSESNFKILEKTRDLHGEQCDYESKKYMTEYEEKFHNRGKNINYVKFQV